MAPNPKAVLNKKNQAKKWNKNVPYYVAGGVAVFLCLLFFWQAEKEASIEREWAATYERKCEACQTMIVSGIMIHSQITQQEKKRIDDERAENPDLPAQEPNPPRAAVVTRYMCEAASVDNLLQHQPMRFGDGFETHGDPDFAAGMKKLCLMAITNSTTTRIFRSMFEPKEMQRVMQNLQASGSQPTLVGVAQVHFEPVCMKRLAMCTQEQLDQGMVDTQAEDAARAAQSKDAAAPAGGAPEYPQVPADAPADADFASQEPPPEL
jgi:hypothetical protein